jgi:hypothetical protein
MKMNMPDFLSGHTSGIGSEIETRDRWVLLENIPSAYLRQLKNTLQFSRGVFRKTSTLAWLVEQQYPRLVQINSTDP